MSWVLYATVAAAALAAADVFVKLGARKLPKPMNTVLNDIHKAVLGWIAGAGATPSTRRS